MFKRKVKVCIYRWLFLLCQIPAESPKNMQWRRLTPSSHVCLGCCSERFWWNSQYTFKINCNALFILLSVILYYVFLVQSGTRESRHSALPLSPSNPFPVSTPSCLLLSAPVWFQECFPNSQKQNCAVSHWIFVSHTHLPVALVLLFSCTLP